MSGLYLGIDTSNYKTSAAVVDENGMPVFTKSEFLSVPDGRRGLRQSECFFRHSCRLPDYFDELTKAVDVSLIRAVGVSSRPRRIEGSYMPCFIAGVNTAREVSSVLGIPVYSFSHQEGHAAAVIENGRSALPEKSILMHLSGGTTEYLLCSMDDNGYETEIIGGTKDISIGQLIDRAGVAMGHPFPAGQYLDNIAGNFSGTPSSILPRIRINDGYFNLSGAETKLLRTIEISDASEYPALIRELFGLIAGILSESAIRLCSEYNISNIYMAGGVSASSFIRNCIKNNIKPGTSINIIFGDPELSGDNAVGTARLAKRIHNETGNSNTSK